MNDSPCTRLVDHHELWCQVKEFNLYPVRYVHDSWIADMPHSDMIFNLKPCRRTHYRLSQVILDYFQLQNHFDYQFQQPEKRVVLLEGPVLQHLIRLAGVSICAKSISQQLSKKTVSLIKSVIGAEQYSFALKKAPYLLGQLSHLSLATNTVDWHDKQAFSYHIDQSGFQLLLALMHDVEPCIVQRMSWKLPKSWWQTFTTANPLPEDKTHWPLLPRFFTKLVREVVPQCYPLFA